MKPFKTRTLLMAALLFGTLLSIVAGVPLIVGAAAAGVVGVAHKMTTLQFHAPGALSINMANLAWGDGDDNMGGLRTKAYYCLHSEIETFSAPMSRDDATNFQDLINMVDHTFVAGKGWKEIYTTEDTGMVETTMQGELDGKSFLNKIKIHFPGARAQLMGFIRYCGNAGMMFCGVDAEGLKRVVGSEHWPAKFLTATITTTETAAGRKGSTIEAQASSPFPAPIITGDLEIEDDSSN